MLRLVAVTMASVLSTACSPATRPSAPLAAGDATEASAAPAQDAAERPERVCESQPDWRYERIALPPEFAPSLPAGLEELYFAPGMFEPAAADYFTYVFSLRFTEPSSLDELELTSMLEAYYRGLMAAVAKGREADFDPATTTVTVTRDDDRWRADVKTRDMFTTGKYIALRMVMYVTPSCVSVAVSPAGVDAPVWADAEAARSCVACE